MLALIGFLMIVIIMYLLVESKATPVPVFVLVPIVAAFAAGVVFPDLLKYIKAGVGTTMPVAAIFMFSVIYFGIMTDVGLFDPLVNFLVKRAGNNVIVITIATGIIATVAHLDGALASTLLITVPAMLPVYKRLNIRPIVVLLIIGAAMSIMNLLPWGGPVARVAAITKTDINLLWKTLIPLQVVGVVIMLGFCALLGINEKRRGAGLKTNAAGEIIEDTAANDVDPKLLALKRPKLIWVNLLITCMVIGLMCFTKIELYAAFMLGLAMALVINFPNVKEQSAMMKRHAPEALSMATIIIASGIFLGILSGAKMLDALAKSMILFVPDFLGPYLHLVMGVLSVPIGMLVGTDSFFFGITPIAMAVGQNFGIEPLNMAKAMLIGKNYGVLTTPHAATTYLAIGLAGVELKELMYYCTPILWILSIISLVAAGIMGIITI